jgi:hypothetical protein
MKTLSSELNEYGMTDAQQKRIMATLKAGKTVRQTYSRDVEAIFVNDDGNVDMVIVNSNGKTGTIERKWE